MNKNTENTDQTRTGSMTTVKTLYARIAILLLALNFCLTGYVVLSMSRVTQSQLDQISSTPAQANPAQAAVPLGYERENPPSKTREN